MPAQIVLAFTQSVRNAPITLLHLLEFGTRSLDLLDEVADFVVRHGGEGGLEVPLTGPGNVTAEREQRLDHVLRIMMLVMT